MKSYGQYCPVAMSLEILGDRWTLLIVRDLLRGVGHFNDLARGLPGVSRTLLASRLKLLVREGIVERLASDDGTNIEYRLTGAGRDLQPVVDAFVMWGAHWAFGDPRPDQLDPVLLMWWMRSTIERDRLPPGRTVVQFDFRGACTDSMWLVLEPDDVSVCLQHPGHEIDLVVTGDLAALYRVWGHRDTFSRTLQCGQVRLDGPLALARAFPGWLGWEPESG
jgi:DNA-binding HxlR family transcriptional regulator